MLGTQFAFFFLLAFQKQYRLSRHGERIGDYCAIGVYEVEIDGIGEKKTIALGDQPNI
jgi:hypothetical protein